METNCLINCGASESNKFPISQIIRPLRERLYAYKMQEEERERASKNYTFFSRRAKIRQFFSQNANERFTIYFSFYTDALNVMSKYTYLHTYISTRFTISQAAQLCRFPGLASKSNLLQTITTKIYINN